MRKLSLELQLHQSTPFHFSLILERPKSPSVLPMRTSLQFLLHLWCNRLVFNHKVFPRSNFQEVFQVSQGSHFHSALGVLVFCAHMWKERYLREVKESRVDFRLVWENIESYSGQLFQVEDISMTNTQMQPK